MYFLPFLNQGSLNVCFFHWTHLEGLIRWFWLKSCHIFIQIVSLYSHHQKNLWFYIKLQHVLTTSLLLLLRNLRINLFRFVYLLYYYYYLIWSMNMQHAHNIHQDNTWIVNVTKFFRSIKSDFFVKYASVFRTP